MPSTELNRRLWSRYDWSRGGEEWSESWGSTANLWHGALLPRVSAFLGNVRALEIGAGYGRISAFLKNHCTSLALVDLVPACLDACRLRFGSDSHVAYLLTDGVSLAGMADETIDFVFSFDSLVHADLATLTGYLRELERVLAPSGTAVIHHSNLAEIITQGNAPSNSHMRARDVSAALVATTTEQFATLECSNQELISWDNSSLLLDCFSTFRRQRQPSRTVRVRETPEFFARARELAELTAWYAG